MCSEVKSETGYGRAVLHIITVPLHDAWNNNMHNKMLYVLTYLPEMDAQTKSDSAGRVALWDAETSLAVCAWWRPLVALQLHQEALLGTSSTREGLSA